MRELPMWGIDDPNVFWDKAQASRINLWGEYVVRNNLSSCWFSRHGPGFPRQLRIERIETIDDDSRGVSAS